MRTQRNDRRQSFSSEKRFSSNSSFSRPREMHKTKCAECGQECEVPFKPDGSRPVYCRDCFRKKQRY